MLQPDKVDIYYGKDSLVLRKMVQQRESQTLLSVALRSLATDEAVKHTDEEFDIAPTTGKFQDIMEDPVASTRIRLMLQDLSRVEEEEAKEAKKPTGPKK
jgi:hypothetical protein